MIKFEPSPWLLLAIPFLLVVGYVTHRGLARNEFRERGRSGWFVYRTGSLDWWISTTLNFLLVGSGAWMVYGAAFHGSQFSREPQLAMPSPTGRLILTTHVDRAPEVVSKCLADLNAAQAYPLGSNGTLVAVRNGRNSVMYTFKIVGDGDGSRVDIRRELTSPFVSWDGCLSPVH